MTNIPGAIVMGFDFGIKKIGIAVGQKITKTATPLKIIKANHGVPNWAEMAKLLAQWQPHLLVVGLPLNMDGSESDMSYLAVRFASKLSGRFNIPYITMDERLTSFEAKTWALNHDAVDAIAAQLILESWFRNQP